MFILRQYYRNHADQFRVSFALYLIVVAVVWPVAFFLWNDTRTALNILLGALLLARTVRVRKLANVPDISLPGLFFAVLVAFEAVIALCLIGYAFSRSQFGPSDFDLGTFKAIPISVALAMIFSVHIDFGIAAWLQLRKR
jgi:hypothetical protein